MQKVTAESSQNEVDSIEEADKRSSCLTPTTTFEDVPKVFREPNINTGFRQPYQPWYYYPASIFQVHNECMNVWTHIFAVILMTHKLVSFSKQLDFINDPYTWPMLAGILSSIILYLASSFAHCFQSKSEMFHYTCFMIDYAGIGLYGFGSVTVHFAYCMEEHLYQISWLKDMFVPVGGFLAVATCGCCTYAKYRYQRPYPRARKVWQVTGVCFLYIWLIIPVVDQVFNCFINGFRCDDTISPHTKQLAWFLASGFFYTSDIPQRFWPGKCDFIGHSHQFFHVCIMMTTFFQFDGVIRDLHNERDVFEQRPTPTLWNTFGPVALVLLLEIVFIIIFREKCKKKLKSKNE
ncbi:membrane progestin receptor beta [Lingula anatina]|uniref:Membrane progestin receptor beta n=1 Tax=Lingula anatina TaxID=7574 RepID=A0A1S3GXV6_LINAN|nr:membrane progestin receptor beta [Lingula anatina]XP_013378700.1 membrane progestin receptor beta [Lingula anatina]|eukprot:XP_013378699.1 membrane progestin receptor beta [Lingula anatina]